MGTACILDSLRGEEEVLGGCIVILPVFRCAVAVRFLAGGIFEEEDYAVDGGEGMEEGGVQCYQFFELDVFDAQVVEEEGEDTL